MTSLSVKESKFKYILGEWSILHFGHFAIKAILAIYLLYKLEFTSAQTTSVIIFFTSASRLSRIIFPKIILMFSANILAPILQLICAAGYFIGAYTTSYLGMLMLVTLIGSCYGLNALLVKTISGNLKKDGSKKLIFLYTYLNIAVNVAAAIGPLIGNYLYLNFNAHWVFIFSSITHFLSAIVAIFFPKNSHSNNTNQSSFLRGMTKAILDPSLRLVWLHIAIVYVFMSQFHTLVPLYLKSFLNRVDLIGPTYTVNAAIVILLQVPIHKYFVRKNISVHLAMFIGFFLFLIGSALLLFSQYISVFFIVIAIWTVAEVICLPCLETIIGEQKDTNYRAISFAAMGLVMAMGEGIGNYFGVGLSHWAIKNNIFFIIPLSLCAWATLAMIIPKILVFLEGDKRYE
ncbi:MFS transporter [bacterium]|nr:MFS transporter [bacterium]